jgi:hypothetical protein
MTSGNPRGHKKECENGFSDLTKAVFPFLRPGGFPLVIFLRLLSSSPIEPIRAFIYASARAGLVHGHLAQQRQAWLRFVPDPASEILAGRILKARNLIQIMMIETLEDRLKCGLHVRKVHDPTAVHVDLAAHLQLDPKRVAMQSCALVTCWHVRQPMRCLYRECAKDMHDRSETSERSRWLRR